MVTYLRLLIIAAAAWSAASAQDLPQRPLRIIVPVPPGGSLDLLARTVSTRLSPRIGQPVIIENVPGAGGNIAFAAAAKAAPDGTTLLHGWDPLLINLALYQPAPYELKQFAPVTLAITAPQILVGSPKLEAKDLKELLAQAKAAPKSISIGSPGNGSPGHLAIALLENLTQTSFIHVPYKGGGPAVADALASHVNAIFLTLPAALTLVQQGKLKPYGVSSARRFPAAPDIPTIAELGVPGYELASWQGFLVPAGTPRAIIGRLNHEITGVLRTPEVRDQLTTLGFEVAAEGPEPFEAALKAGAPRWAQLVRQSGARID